MKIFPVLFLAVACCGCEADAVLSAPGDMPISEIQGNAAVSPLEGQQVTVTGIVSGDFQDDDANPDSLGGFYLQSLAADDDPRSSEGLFVFDRNAQSAEVIAGDVVQVSGRVDERFGETQLNASTVRKVGRKNLRLTELTLPAAAVMTNSDEIVIADLERYEGMLVRIEQPLFVQDLAGLGRYGEIQLSSVKRQFQFTSTQTPDASAYREHRARVATQTLLLDDGRVEQNVSPVRYLSANGLPARAPRIGDAVEGLQGVLRYSRGSGPNGLETWRLMPTAEPQF
ncbi:MAG: hypothetical protein HKN56_09910, partial [Gammaproteobacteria bacterium]|nr:hypothetical protein [Gammaproteobacteria bacterium]